MKRGELSNLLCILIVETSRAKKLSCYRMVEAPIHLDILAQGLRWWIHMQNIPHIPIHRENPVQNCPPLDPLYHWIMHWKHLSESLKNKSMVEQYKTLNIQVWQ